MEMLTARSPRRPLAALLLYGLGTIPLSLLFGVLAGDVAAMLIPPGLFVGAVAAGLIMRRLQGGERPPAS